MPKIDKVPSGHSLLREEEISFAGGKDRGKGEEENEGTGWGNVNRSVPAEPVEV